MAKEQNVKTELAHDVTKWLAHFINPKMANHFWPSEATEEEEIPDVPDQLSAEAIEAGLREYGFMHIPDR